MVPDGDFGPTVTGSIPGNSTISLQGQDWFGLSATHLKAQGFDFPSAPPLFSQLTEADMRPP
jgi:hypothetical protein